MLRVVASTKFRRPFPGAPSRRAPGAADGGILVLSPPSSPGVLLLDTISRHAAVAAGRRSFSSTSGVFDVVDPNCSRIRELPPQYLRAADASRYDPATLQRRCDSTMFDGRTGKPLLVLLSKRRRMHRREGAPESKEAEDDGGPAIIQECSRTDDFYRVVWTDGLVSQYSKDWVEEKLKQWKGGSTADDARTLWSGLTEEQVRCPSSSSLCQTFDQVVRGKQEGMTTALKTLYEYGILLVTHTPIHDRGAGVAALAAALGGGSIKNDTSLWTRYNNQDNNQQQSGDRVLPPHSDGGGGGTDGPLRTLYGTVWSTTTAGQADGASVADSAYGHDALPLHTDMTYHRDPPGLQIFTMVQPAARGGESVFGDGWAVAEQLRRLHPDAFDTLSQTVRRYRCVDRKTGWHLEASGPVLQVDHRSNRVVMIRHNDLDRLPDLPPPPPTAAENGVDEFYQRLEEAHAAWDELLARDETRLKIALRPGDTMVVANQRCLHGRYSFEASPDAPRSVIGCYVSQDELGSRFRQCGFPSY